MIEYDKEELERASLYPNFKGCRDELKVLMLRCIEAENIEKTQAAWTDVVNWKGRYGATKVEEREIEALANNVHASLNLAIENADRASGSSKDILI